MTSETQSNSLPQAKLVLMGLVTLIGFPILGAVILFLSGSDILSTILRSESSLTLQLVLGIAIGFIFGFLAKVLISSTLQPHTLRKYAVLVARLKLSNTGIVLLSLCAGVGEELLFRGAIQPLLGVWFTALIFVALHGYLHPKNWRLTIYGVYMTFVIATLGYCADYIGIWTACVAHMVIDIVLFKYLRDQVSLKLQTDYFNELE